MVLRVVFAEDNLLVREGVAALLSETDDIELVATVTDPGSLLEAVAEHRPDAVLTDIRMPPTFTTEGIDLLSEGVAGLGYLLKERVSQGDDLVRALHDVARGGSVLDPRVVEGLLARKAQESRSPLHGLTDREREVLEAMAAGRSNSATAKALFMSERAVEKHVGSVFQKLGLTDESDVNRRVMAVLAFLEATGGPTAR